MSGSAGGRPEPFGSSSDANGLMRPGLGPGRRSHPRPGQPARDGQRKQMRSAAGPSGQADVMPGSAPLAPAARWRKDFPGDDRELRTVRRWLESVLPPCPARDDVLSVAGELTANAVEHTRSGQGGAFGVEITWRPMVVRVTVADQGAPGGPRIIEDPDGEDGRGLLVVRELSLRVGARGDARGRVVWSDIAWDGPAPELPPDHDAPEPEDGATVLARRFGVPVWIGHRTGQWWALADRELVSAPSAPELAALLTRLLAPPGSRDSQGSRSGHWQRPGQAT